MSFENLGLQPLNEQEAHDEANMIRAKLGVSAETGKVRANETGGREQELTAEDYESAIRDLEQLKAAVASENPDSEHIRVVASDLLPVIPTIHN